jgi:hypothetical protein
MKHRGDIVRKEITRLTTVGLAVAGVCLGAAALGAQRPAALSPMDHIEIQQLVWKYAYALDTGAENGYAYADLFTADATFIGMNQGAKGRGYKGREALAALARGPKKGPLFVSHFTTGVIIEPSPEGATGRVYVVMAEPNANGQGGSITNGGHYRDVYVKTPAGWRFKSRVFFASEVGPTPKQSQSPSEAPIGGVQ